MVRLETLYRKNKSRATRLGALSALSILLATIVAAQFVARDPGVRGGSVDAGQPLDSLAQTPGASNFFMDGLDRFQEIDTVQRGLGPRFNTNQCASCHSQPAVGGSSPNASVFPFVGPNPETQVFNLDGAQKYAPTVFHS